MAMERRRTRWLAAVAVMAVFLAWAGLASGPRQAAIAAGPDPLAGLQLPPAVDACVACHESPHVLAILHGPHGVASDPRTGYMERGCAGCHGDSEAHMRRPPRGEPRAAPDVVFPAFAQRLSAVDPLPGNAMCLDCHRGSAGMHWSGSVHDTADVACSTCHQVHVVSDPIKDPLVETQLCASCHARTHAELLRPSAHPVLGGQMACSDCHNAHGGVGPSLLTANTVNESCTTCHADLRGPFLWEHPPAAEDCLACHRPHGSAHQALRVKRTPWLCQDCHLAQFHPSAALSGTGLPGAQTPSGSQSMLGRDCMNCHVHVHGTNHPSGVGTTR